MKKSRFTDTQIVAILNELEAGMKISDLCRKHGISNQAILCLETKIWWNERFRYKTP